MPWLGVSQTRFSIGNTDMSTNNFNSPQIAHADRTCKTKGPLPYSEPQKCTPRRVCNRKDPRELPVTTENLDISTREEIAEIKAKAAENCDYREEINNRTGALKLVILLSTRREERPPQARGSEPEQGYP